MTEIPQGPLAAPVTDDDAAAARRRRIAEMLRDGDDVMVSQTGTLHEPGQAAPDGSAAPTATGGGEAPVELIVPVGKLAV